MSWWDRDDWFGKYCHWCGERCEGKRPPKTGRHRFCCDACKMAHARAFAAWEKNRARNGVTRGARAPISESGGPGAKSNVKRSTRRPRPAGRIAGRAGSKSNAGKRRKC